MYCVCSNGPIRSQRSLLLTWSPFHDFSQWGTSPCNHSLSYYPGTLSFSHISASRLKLGHPRMICHFCSGATITKRDRRNHHWDLDMDKQSCRIKLCYVISHPCLYRYAHGFTWLWKTFLRCPFYISETGISTNWTPFRERFHRKLSKWYWCWKRRLFNEINGTSPCVYF